MRRYRFLKQSNSLRTIHSSQFFCQTASSYLLRCVKSWGFDDSATDPRYRKKSYRAEFFPFFFANEQQKCKTLAGSLFQCFHLHKFEHPLILEIGFLDKDFFHLSIVSNPFSRSLSFKLGTRWIRWKFLWDLTAAASGVWKLGLEQKLGSLIYCVDNLSFL